MDVGTTLVLIFALTLAHVRALPGNDHEGDVDVCGNTCKANELCDESQGRCLDCSLCVTSVYCAIPECQGGNNTNATTNGDTKRKLFLTSTVAICGGFGVACVGAYFYFFHPLGLRSQEIMKERDQMAGINSEEIYRRGKDKATEKVPLQYIMEMDDCTKS